MSETKFTQGEWKVIDGHYPSIIEIKLGECMRMTVVLAATDITYEQGLEREANAHLIAAAPEMYEMLLRMQGLTYRLSCYESGLTESERDDLRKEYSDINELLAKARGEA